VPGDGFQCASESGMRDEGSPLAIGLQEQVANRLKQPWSKVSVVSVTERYYKVSGMDQRRRTTMNFRLSVEIAQMISKPGSEVAPGIVWSLPAYESGGIRHKGSVSLIRALILKYGNLRWRCKAKDTSRKGKAESSDEPSRGGTARSSDESTEMVEERRSGVIQVRSKVNHESGRNCWLQ
jgi:hypothetical protein